MSLDFKLVHKFSHYSKLSRENNKGKVRFRKLTSFSEKKARKKCSCKVAFNYKELIIRIKGFRQSQNSI